MPVTYSDDKTKANRPVERVDSTGFGSVIRELSGLKPHHLDWMSPPQSGNS